MFKTLIVSLAIVAAGCAHGAQEAAARGAQGIQSVPLAPPAAADTPAGTVDAFAAALRAGDQPTVQRLLAPDVVIAEGGGAERSFAEYAEHHFPADVAFTSAMQFTLERREVIDGGDIATVITQSQAQGEFRDRAVHVRMMETMVLQRLAGAWRIVHIHWSSAPVSNAH